MLALAPAVALATGPSAGDNQYTDPLKSTTTAHTTPPPTSTTTAAPPPAATPPPVSTAPATPVPAQAPTATTAATTTSTSVATPTDPSSLPRTGYESWLAALLGGGLVALGFGIRLRYQGPRRNY
jgi:hypothetical protein